MNQTHTTMHKHTRVAVNAYANAHADTYSIKTLLHHLYMTLGMAFRKWRMYFWHLWISTVSRNSCMPCTRCSFVFGFTSLFMYSFSSYHIFSMGLQSRDSAGVFHQVMDSAARKSYAFFDVCFGSLSCMKR